MVLGDRYHVSLRGYIQGDIVINALDDQHAEEFAQEIIEGSLPENMYLDLIKVEVENLDM